MSNDNDPRRPDLAEAKQRAMTGYLLSVIAGLAALLTILLFQRYG
jgi:hypothetical protein